uniref:Uncharacterized protein n=1 Tax=Anguilla anguilla TaxID=7936 RepID=A0A0E9RZU0_ANGAN
MYTSGWPRIRISVGRGLGLHPLQDQRRSYLDFGQSEVL